MVISHGCRLRGGEHHAELLAAGRPQVFTAIFILGRHHQLHGRVVHDDRLVVLPVLDQVADVLEDEDERHPELADLTQWGQPTPLQNFGELVDAHVDVLDLRPLPVDHSRGEQEHIHPAHNPARRRFIERGELQQDDRRFLDGLVDRNCVGEHVRVQRLRPGDVEAWVFGQLLDDRNEQGCVLEVALREAEDPAGVRPDEEVPHGPGRDHFPGVPKIGEQAPYKALENRAKVVRPRRLAGLGGGRPGEDLRLLIQRECEERPVVEQVHDAARVIRKDRVVVERNLEQPSGSGQDPVERVVALHIAEHQRAVAH